VLVAAAEAQRAFTSGTIVHEEEITQLLFSTWSLQKASSITEKTVRRRLAKHLLLISIKYHLSD
jgi:membrane-anchored protein YejM (alkaline phosphatase superfamily)